MLEDEVGRELAVLSADVESIGVVMRPYRRAIGGSPGWQGRVAAARTIREFIHCAEMDWAIGETIFHRVVPTAVVSVAAAGHRPVITDVRKGISASGRIVLEHRVGAERALTTEGERAEFLGRYTAIVFVIEGLARTRAVDGFRIAGPGQAVVDDVGGWRVGEQAGLRIDASGSVEHDGPARRKLFLAPDAETRLLQVVRRDQESRLIAVAVHQRFAFIVVAVHRQAVADPADAHVIRAVHGNAVPGQRAIGGGELAAAG